MRCLFVQVHPLWLTGGICPPCEGIRWNSPSDQCQLPSALNLIFGGFGRGVKVACSSVALLDCEVETARPGRYLSHCWLLVPALPWKGVVLLWTGCPDYWLYNLSVEYRVMNGLRVKQSATPVVFPILDVSNSD